MCDATRAYHTDDRAKPSADDTDGKEGDENGKRALAKKEESMKDDIGMADKPASDTSGGDDSSSGTGAEPKTDMRGEVSTPQPESMTKAETSASASDAGRDRGRWWGGRASDTVAPASEVSVGERASAEPDDSRVTEGQDSQVDATEPVKEADEADSSSVRGGVESVPRWTPANGAPGDDSRTSRKDYTGSGKPKWQKGSGRGGVDGSEEKKAEESGGAVDEEEASAEDETAMGQDETETAEGSLMHGVVDASGVGAVDVGGAVSANTNSDGVTNADPEAYLEYDEESSLATADGAAGHSSEDGLIDDSGGPRGDDDRPAEGVLATETEGGDTSDGLTASDQADVEVASSLEKLVTITGDTAEADTAEEGVTESASGGEPATGSDDISTAVDSSAEMMSLETADAK